MMSSDDVINITALHILRNWQLELHVLLPHMLVAFTIYIYITVCLSLKTGVGRCPQPAVRVFINNSLLKDRSLWICGFIEADCVALT